MALLRVFDVPPTPAGGKGSPAIERAGRVTLMSDGDRAKDEARTLLEATGVAVRSLNWGPNELGVPELIAYVTPKEEA